MATGVVLKRLQQRASQADHLIAQLRSQLDVLKRNAGRLLQAHKEKHDSSRLAQAEEERLATENATLKQEVEQMREKLIRLETNHGVKQVPLPTLGSHPMAKSAPAVVTAPAKGDKKEEWSQQKAEKKPKKEGKPKQQPQAPASETVDVSCLDMRIGLIVNCKKHPDADSLYVEEVDLGEGKNRTIVSGLVHHVPLEEMQKRLAVFMCNLKPAKMRGIVSEGMIMCASTPQKVEILVPPEGAAIGDAVTVEGYSGVPPAMLPPKKKMWEQVQPDLLVSEEGYATYKGAKWIVGDKGNIKAPTMRGSGIK